MKVDRRSGGVFIVKVYKQNNKLVVYVPFEVIEALGLKGNDEVDFFKFNDASFLFAKKSDITNLIVSGFKKENADVYSGSNLSADEIGVLKKLDTVRYPMRNKDKVEELLNSDEKGVLQQLIKKRAVVLFKDQKSRTELYSISKSVYDRFLMRKKRPETQASMQPIRIESKGGVQNENAKLLEDKGFIVLQSEAEASSLSLALEESIRQGLVIGTRSFSKKFYIVLRSFFDRYSSKILKSLRDGESRIGEISSEVGVDEDGARAILYLLAESGDVTEKRRDVFELA